MIEGIGMVISKQMVDLLGENGVRIHSELNVGTKIVFWIIDKYCPRDKKSEGDAFLSVNEFAEEGINSMTYHRMDKRQLTRSARTSTLHFCTTPKKLTDLSKKMMASSQLGEASKNTLTSSQAMERPKKEKIYILLDDSSFNLALLKIAILKIDNEAVFEEFTDPKELLKFLAKEDLSNNLAVFFLDIEVGSTITGFDVAKTIREKYELKRGEVFLVSYSGHEASAIKKNSMSFDAFLPKPFTDADIKDVFFSFIE